jgi:hypothetical protein
MVARMLGEHEAGGSSPPTPTEVLTLFRGLKPQELTSEVIEFLAILAHRGPESVVVDDADLLREPFRPALRTNALLDLVADRSRQDASRARSRLAAAHAGHVGHA